MQIKIDEEGFDKLINKLNNLSDAAFKECARPALNDTATKLKGDMKSYAPVSTTRPIHGVDSIGKTGIRMARSGYYYYFDVGFSRIIGGHGADYWTAVRGLWFQEFKTDEPNFGWYSRNVLSKKNKYQDVLEENLIIQIRRHFFDKL